MHPLLDNVRELTSSALDERINKLTNYYFMTSNTEVKSQIAMTLETYNAERERRHAEQLEKISKNKGLEKLINVSNKN